VSTSSPEAVDTCGDANGDEVESENGDIASENEALNMIADFKRSFKAAEKWMSHPWRTQIAQEQRCI
jgi:hypothetical protein